MAQSHKMAYLRRISDFKSIADNIEEEIDESLNNAVRMDREEYTIPLTESPLNGMEEEDVRYIQGLVVDKFKQYWKVAEFREDKTTGAQYFHLASPKIGHSAQDAEEVLKKISRSEKICP